MTSLPAKPATGTQSASRLALDHITAVDADPVRLVKAARGADCDGICLFMQSMDVLPLMPKFDLYSDRAARRALRVEMDAQSVSLDLAYPFTLAGRTVVADFTPAIECAAELGAGLLNVLIYDRDPARRAETFGAFCDLARSFGQRVALEFYPVSQVRSLADALEMIRVINRPGAVGINVDLLHLMRSGGSLAELAATPPSTVLYGQFSDGSARCADDQLDHEASSARLWAGEGVFDVSAFAKALPANCLTSVEIPRNDLQVAGVPLIERVAKAVSSVRAALSASA